MGIKHHLHWALFKNKLSLARCFDYSVLARYHMYTLHILGIAHVRNIKFWHGAISWAALTAWPGLVGSFLLTLASPGKEWPSFLWTRHCVRSPGSGRPFHFMVHRPSAWLWHAFRCGGGNVSWNWCPCQRRLGSPFSFAECATSLIGELPSRRDVPPRPCTRPPAPPAAQSSLALAAKWGAAYVMEATLPWPHLHWLNGNQTV